MPVAKPLRLKDVSCLVVSAPSRFAEVYRLFNRTLSCVYYFKTLHGATEHLPVEGFRSPFDNSTTHVGVEIGATRGGHCSLCFVLQCFLFVFKSVCCKIFKFSY